MDAWSITRLTDMAPPEEYEGWPLRCQFCGKQDAVVRVVHGRMREIADVCERCADLHGWED